MLKEITGKQSSTHIHKIKINGKKKKQAVDQTHSASSPIRGKAKVKVVQNLTSKGQESEI